jgi:hypothetical protein
MKPMGFTRSCEVEGLILQCPISRVQARIPPQVAGTEVPFSIAIQGGAACVCELCVKAGGFELAERMT